jgi:hypothetical protein
MSRPVNSLDNIRANAVRDENSGCLLYTGALDKDGYPKISLRGKMGLGSHVVFTLFYGAIPAGHEVDHICHVRRCIEPTHLRALTHRENVIHSKAYEDKRHRRLRTLIDAHPHVTAFPVLLTSPELQTLWQCTGDVKKLLRTMSNAFPAEFHYERFKAGQGSKAAVYSIGIQPSLIDKLPDEDKQRVTPAVDIMLLVA